MTTSIPVLLYHSISATPTTDTTPLAVSPREFARHIEALTAAGVRLLTVSELAAALPNVEGKVAAITFDDGYLDFALEAVPVMLEHDVPSTLYVTTGFLEGGDGRVERPPAPMMHWSQLAAVESARVEIGAHGHSHLEMDTLDRQALTDELRRPKAMLEDALGHRVDTLAYPRGHSSPAVRRQARKAGYKSAVEIGDALAGTDSDVFRIARLRVTAATPLDQIEKWAAGEGTVASGGETLGSRLSRWRRRRDARRTPQGAHYR